MDKFWELFKESVIIQALIALTLIGTISCLLLTNREVPTEVISLFSVILGYYFGSKGQQALSRR